MKKLFKLTLCAMAAGSAGAYAGPPLATELPTGGQVVAGSASISQGSNAMQVTQSSTRAAIDWQSFNIGNDAHVNFVQPSASSVTLNRVLGANASQIFGQISSNGRVYLSNPNGVYFAPGARADVGALLATTHQISNADFMAGLDRFTRSGASGSILNEGQLTADLQGFIALLAPQVRNQGVILARLGTVALAAGEAYTLQFNGNNTLADVQVEASTIQALVDNRSAVLAPGGTVLLSAQALGQLQGAVVNHSGTIEANGWSLHPQGGTVRLLSSGSTAVSGSIGARGDARGDASGGDGGFVETSGSRLSISDSSRVDTRAPNGKAGLWLLDPDGFTIAASGGDISGATLSANLATGDVSIASTSGSGSSGNIEVKDAVSWVSNGLTLTATNDINILAVMSASGSARLSLLAGSNQVNTGFNSDGSFKGHVDFNGSGTLTMNVNGTPTVFSVINSLGAAGDEGSAVATLQGMANSSNLNTHFVLGSNIDASASASWNAGAGFVPIGNASTPYTGLFDGLGHVVSGLTINRLGSLNVGLFGYKTGHGLRNVGLAAASITATNDVGALVGAGQMDPGEFISNSFAQGSVRGQDTIGGLVGYLVNVGSGIRLSYAKVDVQAPDPLAYSSYVGGLVGFTQDTTIQSSFATGNVLAANSYAGGLVGGASNLIVRNSFATGNVSGGNFVGGLIGDLSASQIINSYAAGSVQSTGANVAGLIVDDGAANTLSNSFYDSTKNAGLTGRYNGAAAPSAVADVAGGVWGMSTTDLQNKANFTTATAANGNANPGWNFGPAAGAWGINPAFNNGMPCLLGCFIPTNIYLRLLSGGSSVYGSTPNLVYGLFTDAAAGSTVSDAAPTGTVTWTGAPGALSNAGSYSVSYASGISIANDFYALLPGNAVGWTVNPKTVTLSASKTYDGTTSLNGAVQISTGVGSQTLGYSGAIASDAHVATAGKFISAITLLDGSNGGLAANYTLPTLNAANAPVGIGARTLTVSLGNTGVTKLSDGNTSAPGGFVPLFNTTGLSSGDTAASIGYTSALFASAQPGTGNTLTVAGLSLNGISGSLGSQTTDYVLGTSSVTVSATITSPVVPPAPIAPLTPAIAPAVLPAVSDCPMSYEDEAKKRRAERHCARTDT